MLLLFARLPAKNLIGIAFKFVCHAVELTLRCPCEVGVVDKQGRGQQAHREIMTGDSKSFSATKFVQLKLGENHLH